MCRSFSTDKQRRGSADLGQLSARAPALAGDEAFRRFCTPRLSDQRPANYRQLVERARFHLRHARETIVESGDGRLAAYIFEPERANGRSALLVHGWSGEASFMAAIAEPVRRAGFRVVLFDLPAHGRSEGRATNLAACARATLAVAETLGPFWAAIGHSIGCLAALYVGEGGPPLSRAYPFERYVLISCPNRLADVTRTFGRSLNLSEQGQRAYEKRIERVGHRSVALFSAAGLLERTGRRAVLIHSRDDEAVPFADAEAIRDAVSSTVLKAHDGLGHRRILYAPPVMREVMAAVSR
jgi:pimeloyl-ACP methyl ester carboxylesterase